MTQSNFTYKSTNYPGLEPDISVLNMVGGFKKVKTSFKKFFDNGYVVIDFRTNDKIALTITFNSTEKKLVLSHNRMQAVERP